MRVILGCALTALLVAAAGVGADDKVEKIDAGKLIGKWHPKEKKDVVIEFKKEGKLGLTLGEGDKAFKAEGTYKLDGNKLTTTLKAGAQEKTNTITISKLTDTELTGKDENGKEDTLVRIKDK
ncbi:hypothetical protein GobsT_13440 [Gemmata obscuriglobus]|nr:TIGR03066 family protein [Gemmata obscuriglobus]QEG26601.1 hypothetical protein GobsT_13440 [Gemmata obscuriglobus]VTS02092.1 unnamed protein product [Gemmata obscuriglobus UQM 2246]